MAWFGGLFGKKDAQAMEILPSGEVDTEDALAVPLKEKTRYQFGSGFSLADLVPER